jgi:hypothetical protein
MRQYLFIVRTAITTLGVLTSCFVVTAADAAPVRKAHARTRCAICRRVPSPKQVFARIANRRPDRAVRRHVTPLVRKARSASYPAGDEAAIQNDVSTVSVEDNGHKSPPLEAVGVLRPIQAQLKNHEGFVRPSPRGPPVFS